MLKEIAIEYINIIKNKWFIIGLITGMIGTVIITMLFPSGIEDIVRMLFNNNALLEGKEDLWETYLILLAGE